MDFYFIFIKCDFGQRPARFLSVRVMSVGFVTNTYLFFIGLYERLSKTYVAHFGFSEGSLCSS